MDEVMKQSRGAGYWSWKPVVILDAMRRARWGDVVMYADAATHFQDSIGMLDQPHHSVASYHLFPLRC
jgi:3,4-dihydroxy-2-butanone 4-phosphate synthase